MEFASSMANISCFYPERRKGLALGLNAAGGNIGAAVVQSCVPLLLGLGGLAVVGGGAGRPGQSIACTGLHDHVVRRCYVNVTLGWNTSHLRNT